MEKWNEVVPCLLSNFWSTKQNGVFDLTLDSNFPQSVHASEWVVCLLIVGSHFLYGPRCYFLWYNSAELEWNVSSSTLPWLLSLDMFSNEQVILTWLFVRLIISHVLNKFPRIAFYSNKMFLDLVKVYILLYFDSQLSRYHSNIHDLVQG